MGRPPGVKNGEGTTQLAPIAKWTPKHEAVVQLHIAGWPNDKIGEETGLTPTRVSQVLQDPKAKEIIQSTIKRIREQAIESIEDGLAELAVQSVGRLAETIEQKFVPGTDEKKHQDKVALKLTRGFIPSGEEAARGQHPGESLPVKLVDRLVTALENSDKAREINKDVQEADYTIEESSDD